MLKDKDVVKLRNGWHADVTAEEDGVFTLKFDNGYTIEVNEYGQVDGDKGHRLDVVKVVESK